MIHLATSYTEGYPWIEPFRKSLTKYMNPDDEYNMTHWRAIELTDPPPDTRTWVIQNGAFLDRVPSPYRDDLIGFMDADMICQRRFSRSEMAFFVELYESGADRIAMGVNQHPGATLEDEAKNLGQVVDDDVLDRIFPGWRQIPVWNCGFMVARRSTWQRIHDLTVPLMLPAESCFSHYATIQWVICYAVGRWLNHVLLPETICVHGLCGYRDYMTADREGNVYVNGTMAAFRHAINLTPHKCLRIEPA